MDNIDNSVRKIIDLLDRIPHDYANITQRTPYYNMAATLTDSVLQAGMNYKSVVYPRVYNILNRYSNYKTTCDFIILFQTIPIEEIIQWKNKRKQDTICDLAWYLYNSNVNTEDDLAEWIMNDRNADSLLEISGVGRKTVDYMKLLSGQQAIPIDRHMFQFLEIAGVLTSDYKEASMILRKTASVLKIGESVLDKTIWMYMSGNKTTGQISIFDICVETIS
jgi:3-methyladenine DNA glycosylase/8-oxoguanine DNA glycosylase